MCRSCRRTWDIRLVSVLATTFFEVLENRVTLELEQQRYLRTGFSDMSPHRVLTSITRCLLSAPCPMRSSFSVPSCTLSEPWKAQFRVFQPLRVLGKVSHTTCGVFYWSCHFTSRIAALSNLSSMKLTWLWSHSLVVLLLIYSSTKVFTILHDTPSGTIARGVFFYYGTAPLPPLSIDVLKFMKEAVHSVRHRQRICVNYCWPLSKSRIASIMASLLLWTGQRSVLSLCGRTAARSSSFGIFSFSRLSTPSDVIAPGRHRFC